jgi:death on curing protein
MDWKEQGTFSPPVQMKREWTHLTPASVLAIHESVLAANGGMPGVRDTALLESAVAAPQATMFGDPLLKDGIEIAAAYLFYLCRNHPFLDGNKRTALAACLVFMDKNKLFSPKKLDVDAWEALVLDLAASRIDREQTTKRLESLLTA